MARGGAADARPVRGDLAERALDVVRSIEKSRETVMLVGHEPTWSELATLLVGGGRLRLPTAGLLHVAFDCDDWAEVGPEAGVLHALVTPALLRDKATGDDDGGM